MKLCFFIGHSDAPESLKPKLDDAIERHIADFGVDSFVVGNYGRFDWMAQSALRKAKKRRPEILVQMGVPYHPAIRRVELPDGFDSAYFPEGQENVPKRAAIPRLNRVLVNEANFLIAYVWHISGGAYKLMEYARNRESRSLLRITMLEN